MDSTFSHSLTVNRRVDRPLIMCAQLTRTHGEVGVEQTASWLNADTGQDVRLAARAVWESLSRCWKDLARDLAGGQERRSHDRSGFSHLLDSP